MPKKYPLGWGNGRIVEYEDGTAGYIPTQSFSQAFRVKIADVTGFSVTKSGKILTRTVNVLGNGTLLGSAEVNHGTAEKIEAWFMNHPSFGRSQADASITGTVESVGVADEIKKLAALRSEGVLTEQEFVAQKSRLLSGV